MEEIRMARLENGKRVWLEEEGCGRWIFFEDEDGCFDETSGMEVPSDSLDYKYTHGNSEYREACEKLKVL